MKSVSESRCWQVRESDAQVVKLLPNWYWTIKTRFYWGKGLEKGDSRAVVGEEWGMWPLEKQQEHKRWSSWLNSIYGATEFGETKLLEVPNGWGSILTGGKNSVVADTETPPTGIEWPSMTFSAFPCLQSPSPWPCPSLLPGMFVFMSCKHSFSVLALTVVYPGHFVERTGVGKWIEVRQSQCVGSG